MIAFDEGTGLHIQREQSKRAVTQTKYSGLYFPDRVKLLDEGLCTDTPEVELKNCTVTR
jgi:hypothetical protein